MEATITTQGHRMKKENTRGKKKHWSVWLIFGLALAIIILEAFSSLEMIFFPN